MPKPGYKQTELGEIPEEWEVVRLRDIGQLKDGDWILKEYYQDDGEVRLLQVGDIGIGKFLDKSRRFISEESAKKLKVTYVKPMQHILISRMPDPIGRACIAPELPYPYIVAVDITMLEVKKNVADRDYICWFLNSPINFKQVETQATGATRKRISRKNLEKIKIPLPSLPEQRRIAKVLSTVDAAIEKTDEEIEHTERLKKGLMQRLLTRGIGHEKFKDTEIGRIPEEWEVVRLGNVVEKTEKIDPTKTPDKKFRYLDISNIDNKAFRVVGWNEIIGKTAPSRARKLIKAGDVVFATTRPYLKNIAIVPPELDNQICSTGFCVLRANKNKAVPRWIFYNLLTDGFISRISARMVGATYPAVSDKDVFKMKIPLPPLEEQRRIAEILSTVDRKLELLRARRERLERVKKGLMNDLLTGRKRVPEGVV